MNRKMRKIKWSNLLVLTISMFMLCSCLKGSINGDLDGQWQIMQIEHNGADVALEGRKYICVYLHVVQLTEGGVFTDGNMVYDKSSVSFSFPYAQEGYKLKKLEEWGIYTNPVKFDIEQLDRKTLILSNSDTRIICRRF